MFCEVERAPFGFVVEHIEVGIILIVMDKFDCNIFFRVSKRTEIPILAFIQIIRVHRAEFCLILIWLVQLLNSIMRQFAEISIGAGT